MNAWCIAFPHIFPLNTLCTSGEDIIKNIICRRLCLHTVTLGRFALVSEALSRNCNTVLGGFMVMGNPLNFAAGCMWSKLWGYYEWAVSFRLTYLHHVRTSLNVLESRVAATRMLWSICTTCRVYIHMCQVVSSKPGTVLGSAFFIISLHTFWHCTN